MKEYTDKELEKGKKLTFTQSSVKYIDGYTDCFRIRPLISEM